MFHLLFDAWWICKQLDQGKNLWNYLFWGDSSSTSVLKECVAKTLRQQASIALYLCDISWEIPVLSYLVIELFTTWFDKDFSSLIRMQCSILNVHVIP